MVQFPLWFLLYVVLNILNTLSLTVLSVTVLLYLSCVCAAGTRPLMVVTWMEGYVGSLEAAGYDVPRHLGGLAGMQLNNIRCITVTVCLCVCHTMKLRFQ